ncbi:TVG0085666 [Thermoplasma volcanium GSS1]|uniref:TVG0085666 protein n=1 Tax=Thermoplasma volcanium (strain ATCC 51530 / DSM 4299 / JCM 9571 / NBRC 15438 / GSS1) TaxID=273116 RepID=Q97CL6_THEVO|nr:alpha/beta hydrolase [Thermoplasma volcanium]BAB59227.1 TVG0085666 [Thermoplasma volcanium GSS1]
MVDESYVDVSGVSVHYRFSKGSKPRKNLVIVDVNGKREWDGIRFIERIQEWGISVYYPDYPDALDSKDTLSSKSADYVKLSPKFYSDFIYSLHLKNTMLIGSGVNGDVALRCAMEYPERCSNIIVINAPGYDDYKIELYKVQKPVLLIWGDSGGYQSIMRGQSYHDLISDSVFKVFDKSAEPHVDKTEKFYSLLKNYIAED